MGSSESKAQPVVELRGDNNPVYNVQTVKTMMKAEPANRDTKVFVIAISGVYRSGKSFFLNLLKTYLDHYSEKKTSSGWDTSNRRISGGNWAKGRATVTHGIWMYIYPKLIKNRAIILLDCQGSKDTGHSSPTLDNQILFLGLQLSDVHILNVNGVLGADELDRLGLCVFHADDDSSESLFRRQMFLIRNWENDEEPESLDEMIEGTAAETVRNAASGIKKAFKAVEVMTLPHPGFGVARNSEKDAITVDRVEPEFRKKAQEIFQKLVLDLASEAEMTHDEFFSQFKFVSERAIAKISSPKEAYEESLIKGVFMKLSANFKAEIKQLQRRSDMTMEQKIDAVTAAYGRVKEVFEKNKSVQGCESQHLKNDYLGFLQEACNDATSMMREIGELEKQKIKTEKSKRDDEAAKRALEASEYERNCALDEVARLKSELQASKTKADIEKAQRELEFVIKLAEEKDKLRDEALKIKEKAFAEKMANFEREKRMFAEAQEKAEHSSTAVDVAKSLWNSFRSYWSGNDA